MKSLVTRKLLAALGMLLCSTAYASDDGMRYSGLEQRLAALEAQVAAQQGVQSASYLSDSPGDATASGCCDNAASCCDCTTSGCCQPSCGCNDCCGTTYGYYEMLWIRPHVNEDFAGKLSEEHNFSSRYVLGYEDGCGLGARVRYWSYDHAQDVLTDGDTIRFELDVFDLEATNHFCFNRTDLVLAGGLRVANMDLGDDGGDHADIDALGITMAADVRTRLYSRCCNTWSWVYGGRISILGGDWNGDNDFINTIGPAEVRDDNLFVSELYAGLEYGYNYNGWDLFSRVTFEMQNWRSDVLGEVSTTTDSISYIGPGISFGASY